MKTFNKLAIATIITATTFGAVANEKAEDVNYGDPTASFSTVGVSRADGQTQLNGMMGFDGGHIISADLGVADKKTADDKVDYNYRLRYFKVNDGLGYSVDVLGDRESTTALAGVMYKFQVTDNISVFPMLNVGRTSIKDDVQLPILPVDESYSNSNLAQAGVYAMYGFDAGHWLYVNPKATYVAKAKETVTQVEMGGGFMVSDNVSLGFKIEHTAATNLTPKDTTSWIQASVYF